MFIVVKESSNIVSVLDTTDGVIERYEKSKLVDLCKKKKLHIVFLNDAETRNFKEFPSYNGFLSKYTNKFRSDVNVSLGKTLEFTFLCFFNNLYYFEHYNYLYVFTYEDLRIINHYLSISVEVAQDFSVYIRSKFKDLSPYLLDLDVNYTVEYADKYYAISSNYKNLISSGVVLAYIIFDRSISIEKLNFINDTISRMSSYNCKVHSNNSIIVYTKGIDKKFTTTMYLRSFLAKNFNRNSEIGVTSKDFFNLVWGTEQILALKDNQLVFNDTIRMKYHLDPIAYNYRLRDKLSGSNIRASLDKDVTYVIVDITDYDYYIYVREFDSILTLPKYLVNIMSSNGYRLRNSDVRLSDLITVLKSELSTRSKEVRKELAKTKLLTGSFKARRSYSISMLCTDISDFGYRCFSGQLGLFQFKGLTNDFVKLDFKYHMDSIKNNYNNKIYLNNSILYLDLNSI